jgi:hypothetical protein
MTRRSWKSELVARAVCEVVVALPTDVVELRRRLAALARAQNLKRGGRGIARTGPSRAVGVEIDVGEPPQPIPFESRLITKYAHAESEGFGELGISRCRIAYYEAESDHPPASCSPTLRAFSTSRSSSS